MGQPVAVSVWQCRPREPNMSIPIGATWVDYVPEVDDGIEANAHQGVNSDKRPHRCSATYQTGCCTGFVSH